MEQTGIDVVVCLSDTSELPRLNQCAFAVIGQLPPATSAGPSLGETLRLHVMLPRFSIAEVHDTRAAVQALSPLHTAFSLHLHNWEYPEPFRLRIPLLNWGLEVARGRYFTCLGVADLPLPGAVACLLARLRVTRAALALGGMAIQPVRWWGDVVLPLPRFQGAAAYDAVSPLFLLDRARVPVRDLAFREGRPNEEIAEFIEHVTEFGAADTHCLAELLGLRQITEE